MKFSILTLVSTAFFFVVNMTNTGIVVQAKAMTGYKNNDRDLSIALDATEGVDNVVVEQVLPMNVDEKAISNPEAMNETPFHRLLRKIIGARYLSTKKSSPPPPNFVPTYVITDWGCGPLCPPDDDSIDPRKKKTPPKLRRA
jgi:hypothetical protein